VVALVINADNNFGVLLVRPTVYPQINDLSNVNISTVTGGDLLVYDGTDARWENAAQSTITAGKATNLAGGAAGSLPYQSNTDTTTFLAAGSDGQVLKLSSGVPTWSSDASGVTITDDTTTNATRYVTFTDATTGTETGLDVSSTKLTYNPSTGTLASTVVATNTVDEGTSGSGVTVDGVLLKDSEVNTDVINEKTSAAGVTIDSVLLKDNKVTANELTINSNNISADNSLGFRNRIINGDMRIAQRGTAAVTVTASYPVDRFLIPFDNDGAYSAQQSSTAPSNFTNSLQFTTTTADASLSALQYAILRQNIEGFNFSDANFGTANAKTVTLSFWVRSSLTGTFGGALNNNAVDRSYPFTYTISVADTWEYKSVTIAGDTSGTWLTNNSVGARVHWGLGVGSTYSGTAGAWAGATYFSATGAVSVIGTLNATWYVTGVQFEVGSVATPFERRPFGTELALCQRYYYRVTLTATAQDFGNGFNSDTVTARVLVPFPTTMRTNPSAVEQTGTASDYRVRTGTVTACSQVPSFQSATSNASSLFFVVASGLTAGQGCMGGTSVTTGAYLGWSAEL
jgi:hypothetical protein